RPNTELSRLRNGAERPAGDLRISGENRRAFPHSPGAARGRVGLPAASRSGVSASTPGAPVRDRQADSFETEHPVVVAAAGRARRLPVFFLRDLGGPG